jgi:hypothetical protein
MQLGNWPDTIGAVTRDINKEKIEEHNLLISARSAQEAAKQVGVDQARLIPLA